MFWLTWRQHRAQALTTVGLLAVLGVVLLVSGLAAADYLASHGRSGCPGPAPACKEINSALRTQYNHIWPFANWLLMAPAVIGAFWGAPLLAREFERGTNKLAWTQSVPLGRWLAIKLGLLAGAIVLGAVAFVGDVRCLAFGVR